jgi:hypothetical protein
MILALRIAIYDTASEALLNRRARHLRDLFKRCNQERTLPQGERGDTVGVRATLEKAASAWSSCVGWPTFVSERVQALSTLQPSLVP